ncbi:MULTISPECIES: AAA family ATPase [unclassified Caulobacter]|uniref:AAA family ATPase n=1 Tax=unclassified Caulobacter TaxID=2648921 RepID=UPI0004A6C540|nr:AAA family ATPase [Caulobacter sp. UNC358MFTsu5.1]
MEADGELIPPRRRRSASGRALRLNVEKDKSKGRERRASDIRAHLDSFVVGQEEAKERLSLILSMYLSWDSKKNVLHPPPNGLVLGPTGSGKTFSIQIACAYLGIPFLIVDSTTLVPSGARGGSAVEEIEYRINNLIGDRGKIVVFLDEFDKIAAKSHDNNREWKVDIQRSLLKFIEGQAKVAEGGTGSSAMVLAGGAFVDIDGTENTRKRRPEVARLLREAPKGTIVSDDLVNFGFMPELVARLPAIIQYESLPEDALLQILRHGRTSPLLVWRQHFRRIGKTLKFSDGFMRAVAKRAAALSMGARGLQQIVFPALAKRAYAFEGNTEKVINITEEILEI